MATMHHPPPQEGPLRLQTWRTLSHEDYDAMCDEMRRLQELEARLKQRDGDQPLPVVNDSDSIQSMVIADIAERTKVGIERYGTALQPFNGRDALRDAYEESLDLATYLKQAIVERDNAGPSGQLD